MAKLKIKAVNKVFRLTRREKKDFKNIHAKWFCTRVLLMHENKVMKKIVP